MTAFSVRPFRPEDLPRVAEITVTGFEGVSVDRNIELAFGPVAGKGWAERKAREVALDCEAQPDGVFVAEADGAVVGYVTTRLDPVTGVGRIPNLAVAEGHRGRGVGSSLIRHALEFMRQRGMALARIE